MPKVNAYLCSDDYRRLLFTAQQAKISEYALVKEIVMAYLQNRPVKFTVNYKIC